MGEPRITKRQTGRDLQPLNYFPKYPHLHRRNRTKFSMLQLTMRYTKIFSFY